MLLQPMVYALDFTNVFIPAVVSSLDCLHSEVIVPSCIYLWCLPLMLLGALQAVTQDIQQQLKRSVVCIEMHRSIITMRTLKLDTSHAVAPLFSIRTLNRLGVRI